MAGTITVGTSSWADPGFVEEWYPAGLTARERLPWYAERFVAVEVNSTFYAVPGRSTVERWARATPDGFTFDVKLHKSLCRRRCASGRSPGPAAASASPPSSRRRSRTRSPPRWSPSRRRGS